VTQTFAFIYWTVSDLQGDSVLTTDERASIVIAFAPDDRPSSYDIIKTELVTHSRSALLVERQVPSVVSSLTDMN
ncbi:MAG: flagellin, partial [Nitrosopumilaceae archaeon]